MADTSETAPENKVSPKLPGDPEIGVLDSLIVIAKHRRKLLLWPIVCAAFAYGGSFLLPKEYLGQARVMPPLQSAGGGASMLSQLNSLAGFGSVSMLASSPSDVFAGLLQSQSVYDAVIKRFDLQKLYHERRLLQFGDKLDLNATRTWLDEKTDVNVGALDKIVTIQVYERDPRRAADMANAYVEELLAITRRVANTEAGQRRQLFDAQLKRAVDNLTTAENELRKIQERTGIIHLDNQAQVIIQSIANLKAQIVTQETLIASMQSYTTPRNPDYVRAMEALASMQAEAKRLETAQVSSQPGIFVPTGKVPELGLDYVRKYRQVKLYEATYQALVAQVELAKVDEARESSAAQVIDYATPPDVAAKPRRLFVAGITWFVALLIVGFWTFIREWLSRASSDPENGPRISELRASWRRAPDSRWWL